MSKAAATISVMGLDKVLEEIFDRARDRDARFRAWHDHLRVHG
jgi:hypothetical protein